MTGTSAGIARSAVRQGYAEEETRVRYPIAIEPGTDTTAYGVVVPDLPGCFSAGDSLAEAEEAAAAWIDAALDGRVLARIDAKARAEGVSRSRFIAEMALG